MKYGLLGKVLTHSYSKDIHDIFFKHFHIDGTYDYFEVEETNLLDFINYARSDLNGFNVTIPYKNRIIRFLDEIDETAKLLNSVNTVKVIDGKLYGYNTDYFGFEASMNRYGVNFKKKKVVILGSGATSEMVYYYAKQHGASSITIVSRSNKYNNSNAFNDINVLGYDDQITGDILINTTPVGMNEHRGKSPIHPYKIKPFGIVIDLLYNPFHTRLLIEANFLNKVTINGLYMLVAQAVKAQAIWQDTDYSKIEMVNVYHELLNLKVNIVLIGMPNSGKSTIGYFLNKQTSKIVIDTDRYIENDSKQTISELFSISEEHFRKIETSCIKDISKDKGIIISCGGGVVTNVENIYSLAENGVIFFLNRHLNKIKERVMNPNRPLLKSASDIEILFKKRLPLYRKYSNFEIKNYSIKKTISHILKLYRGV